MYKSTNHYGAWSSTAQYAPSINAGVIYYPEVTDNNIVYIANKVKLPTKNVRPSVDTDSWTQTGVVSVTPTSLSYANINSIGRSTNVLANGVLNLLGSRKSNSSDIGYDGLGNHITLPLNKTLNTVFTIGITTATGGTGNIAITGTNCTVNSNLVSLIANTTLLYTCSAVITTTSTASPSISFTLSSITGTVTQITEGNFILNSVN